MPANRIWVNVPKGGDTVFVTFGTRETERVLEQPTMRDLMVATLIDVCSMSETQLHAFAVLPHTVHFLATTAPHWEPADLVKRIKHEAAKQVLPLVSEQCREALVAQGTETEHLMWSKNYRSILIRTSKALAERIEYIHENPVHMRLANKPEEYRWSSARMYREGRFDPEGHLDLGYLYSLFGA